MFFISILYIIWYIISYVLQWSNNYDMNLIIFFIKFCWTPVTLLMDSPRLKLAFDRPWRQSWQLWRAAAESKDKMQRIFLILTLPNPSGLTAVRQTWYAKVTYKRSPGWQLPQQGHSGTTHTSPEHQSWLPRLSPPWAVHSSAFRKPKMGTSSIALIILLNQLFNGT
jgi:hypothetical protein